MKAKNQIPVGTRWKLEEQSGSFRIGIIELADRYENGIENWKASWHYSDGSAPVYAQHNCFCSYRSARNWMPFKCRAFCIFKP